MDLESIKATLYNYIRNTYKVPENDREYTYDVHLFDYGYVDSFGAAELLAFIEQTYGIDVSQKDLMLYPMNTVSEIADYVAEKVGK